MDKKATDGRFHEIGYDKMTLQIVKIPLYTFTKIHIKVDKFILKVTVRDFDDIDLFIQSCCIIRDNVSIDEIRNLNSVVMKKIPKKIIGRFSTIVLVPPLFQQQGYLPDEDEDPEKAILVFPVYDCEFREDISAERSRTMLKIFDYVDWNRPITPTINITYTIAHKTVPGTWGTRSKKLKVAKYDSLPQAVSQLTDDKLSYITFENSLGDIYHIKFIDHQLSLNKDKDENIIFSGEEEALIKIIHNICFTGNIEGIESK